MIRQNGSISQGEFQFGRSSFYGVFLSFLFSSDKLVYLFRNSVKWKYVTYILCPRHYPSGVPRVLLLILFSLQ